MTAPAHHSPEGNDETLCGENAAGVRTVSAFEFVLARTDKSDLGLCEACENALDEMP